MVSLEELKEENKRLKMREDMRNKFIEMEREKESLKRENARLRSPRFSRFMDGVAKLKLPVATKPKKKKKFNILQPQLKINDLI